jgi:hypothetical protein
MWWTPLDPSDRRQRRRRLALVGVVFTAGLLWRLVLGGWIVPAWQARANVGSFPDAYPLLAETLIERGTLGFGEEGATPTTVRGPGFPLWLAAGMRLGLRDGPAVALWSAIPGLLGGAALAWLLAGRYGLAAGAVGGTTLVLHPLSSFAAARAMSDEFYGVLAFVAIACWAGSREASGNRRGIGWLAAGAALGWNLLTRAVGLLTVGAIAIAACLARPRRVRSALMVVLVALVPALAWSVRSTRLERRPVFVHSLAAYNFWFGEAFDRLSADRAPGETRRMAMQLMVEAGADPVLVDPGFWYAQLTPMETAAMERVLGRAAIDRVLERPLSFAARAARGLARFWYAADAPLRSVQYGVVVVPLLLLAGVGAWRILSGEPRLDVLGLTLIVLIVLHNAAYAVTWPMARMSVQVYPAVAYLAGVGADRLLRKRAGDRVRTVPRKRG